MNPITISLILVKFRLQKKIMKKWKQITGFEQFEVSNYGEIRNIKTYKIRKPFIDKPKYTVITLYEVGGINKSKRVHRLVAEAFVPNPENKDQVNHIDGNRLNNRADNLEWVTRAENVSHAVKNNLYAQGEDTNKAKLTEDDVNTIRAIGKVFTQKELAKDYGVTPKTIGRIIRGESWKHLL